MKQFFTLCLGLLLAFGVVSAETVYYENDFESGTAGEVPPNVKVYDLDGNPNAYTFIEHAWQYYNDNGNFTSSMTLISSSKYTNNGDSDDWAIFPKMAVGEGVLLSFVESTISDKPESFEVLISKTGDAVEDFTTVVYTGAPATNHTTTNHDNWNQVVIDLSSFGVDNSDIYIALHNNTKGGGNALFIDNFKVYTLSPLDVELKEIIVPKYAAIGSELPLDIKGTMRNTGIDVVTSVELKFQYNDEDVNSFQISDLNIAHGEDYQFTIPGLTTENLGPGIVKVWVSLINGVEYPTSANNEATAPLTIYDKSQTYVRKPLIEIFTSATCGPCRPGNEVIGNVLPAYVGRYSKVNYQMSWPSPGDRYNNADGNARRTFYAVNSVPETHLDGTFSLNPQSFTAKMMEDALSVPAFVSVDMDAQFSGKDVDIKLTITSFKDMELANLRAFVSINETRTVNNIGSNGETEFFDVEQKMLPSGTGTRVDKLIAGEPYVIELTYSFDGTTNNVEDFDNLYAIAFLQDMNTQEVFNSTVAIGTSVEPEVFNTLDLTVTPNPIEDNATITYNVTGSAAYNVDMKLFDIKGNVVSDLQSAQIGSGMQTIRFDATTLAQGTYYVVLNINGSQVMKPMVITK